MTNRTGYMAFFRNKHFRQAEEQPPIICRRETINGVDRVILQRMKSVTSNQVNIREMLKDERSWRNYSGDAHYEALELIRAAVRMLFDGRLEKLSSMCTL